MAPEELRERWTGIDALTPIRRSALGVNLESRAKNLTQRLINLVTPIGKGQRGLIVSPPKAGKTTVLKNIANGITANHPEIHLMVALIGKRPEEVTDVSRSVKGEVISSTFNEPMEPHPRRRDGPRDRQEASRKRARRGHPDGLHHETRPRLQPAPPPSGRTLSGGIDPSRSTRPSVSLARRATSKRAAP